MTDLWTKLKQRKLVQWALAYVAFAFALLQGIDIVAAKFAWPDSVERMLIIALCVGFFVTVLLAWYHGEQGRQRVSGTELLILALVLALGGGFLWQFSRAPNAPTKTAAKPVATPSPTQSRPSTPTNGTNAPAAAIPAKSIAVLPFENLSEDKGNKYFADGMQDLILTKLADIGDLKVISRTSTAKYASHPDDLKTVGQQLGVATVLEGSVQKAGKQVLINVQLIDTHTDSHLWAQAYTRTLDNVFGVEGEVAEEIAAALKAKLSPSETRRLASALSNDPQANDLYLRAEYFTNHGQINYDTALLKKAILLYRRAIARDPDFALARARLSFAEGPLVWYGATGKDAEQFATEARAQAEQALKLAPDLADAHLALGYCDYWRGNAYAEALKSFDAALAARPNDATALSARAFALRRLGRIDESVEAMKRAVERDPRNTFLTEELGATSMMANRYADAKRQLQRSLALDPDNLQAKIRMSNLVLLQSGDFTRAAARVQGDAPVLQLQRAALLTYQRRYSDALALIAQVPDTAENFNPYFGGSKTVNMADLYRLTGDTARAHHLYTTALPHARSLLDAAGDNIIKRSYIWSRIGQIDLGLGQMADAVAAIETSQSLVARSDDRLYNVDVMRANAALYARAGRVDSAVKVLGETLQSPCIGWNYAPIMLWLDPAWDPIRKTPQFQALLRKYAAYRPANVL